MSQFCKNIKRTLETFEGFEQNFRIAIFQNISRLILPIFSIDFLKGYNK